MKLSGNRKIEHSHTNPTLPRHKRPIARKEMRTEKKEQKKEKKERHKSYIREVIN